jgi:hypothetical protein
MARYKVLQSVAHSFAHSFTSLMNYAGDDYVMGHLLRRARESGETSLVVDILTGSASPPALLRGETGRSVRRYCEWFPKLVASHKSEMQFIRAAQMSVTFELSERRPVRHAPGLEESPYVCRVQIEDDRGKTWSAELRDWWYPESEVSSTHGGRRRNLRSVVSRLGQMIRSVWSRRVIHTPAG